MSVATIGSALAEKRRELGLEKGQAADKIGMSRTTYSSYEQDAQRPSVDVFPALADFLSVSMEELLILYGATCVAAVRPSLERFLLDRSGGTKHELDKADSPTPVDYFVPMETPAWSKELDTSSDHQSAIIAPVPELPKAIVASVGQDQASRSQSTEPATSDMALEPQESSVHSDSEDQYQFPPASFEDRIVPTEVSGGYDSDGDPPTWPDHSSRSTETPEINSVVFEPSPYFIKTSITGSDEKSSDSKKKKKKKKHKTK